jgi:hypothetical protein
MRNNGKKKSGDIPSNETFNPDVFSWDRYTVMG